MRLRGPRRDRGLGLRGSHVRLFHAATVARAVAATDVRAVSATDARALASADAAADALAYCSADARAVAAADARPFAGAEPVPDGAAVARAVARPNAATLRQKTTGKTDPLLSNAALLLYASVVVVSFTALGGRVAWVRGRQKSRAPQLPLNSSPEATHPPPARHHRPPPPPHAPSTVDAKSAQWRRRSLDLPPPPPRYTSATPPRYPSVEKDRVWREVSSIG